jgi:hypothetical protein
MCPRLLSSGQKFLNDHSIWHNFFVSQPIDLKFWSKMYFLVKKLEGLVLPGLSYDLKSEFFKAKSI